MRGSSQVREQAKTTTATMAELCEILQGGSRPIFELEAHQQNGFEVQKTHTNRHTYSVTVTYQAMRVWYTKPKRKTFASIVPTASRELEKQPTSKLDIFLEQKQRATSAIGTNR